VKIEDGRVVGLAPSENGLNGEIPPALGQLSNSAYLELNTSQPSGNIRPQLGQFSYFEGLVLNDNQLSGQIPPELGNLFPLTGLYLAGYEVSGCVPNSLQIQLESYPEDLPFC